MLNKALISKRLESISSVISPTGIVFSDLSMGVFGCHCTFNPSYFKAYNIDEEKEILFKSDLLESLEKLGFGGEDNMSVTLDESNNRLLMKGGALDWKPGLSNFEIDELTGHAKSRIGFALAEAAGIGVLPTDPSRPILSQFSIGVNKLSTPDVEKVTLRFNSNELTQELELLGPFKKKIIPVNIRKVQDGSSTLTVDYLKKMISNLAGEIWVTIYEKVVFLTKITEDYSLMYMLSVT